MAYREVTVSVSEVPAIRIAVRNEAPVRASGRYVLYWMIAERRTRWSFPLQRARQLADELGLPLVVFEPLGLGYRWASERVHRFVIDGMRDNAAACRAAGVTYIPWIEPEPRAGAGLLEALAAYAAVVVTDERSVSELPLLVERAAAKLSVRLEAVDGGGILPLRAAQRTFTMAVHFRRHLQKTLRPHLAEFPVAEPLESYSGGPASLPDLSRWAAAGPDVVRIERLALDHEVGPVALTGGPVTGGEVLARFLESGLGRYADERNVVEGGAASGLSPWLHFGHVGAHEVIRKVLDGDGWAPERLAEKVTAKRAGWWGASAPVEAFLDECITWRELGANFCHHTADPYAWESLPDWARRTMEEHADDPRPHLYELAALEAGETHDPLWNAAQAQLRGEGRIHNYLRMLWGKKVFEWSPTPREALCRLVHLNDRWALDGRDPNSAAGIGWVLGRFDRAWGPERPIFGKLRYMSSDSTRRKLRVRGYVNHWEATLPARGA